MFLIERLCTIIPAIKAVRDAINRHPNIRTRVYQALRYSGSLKVRTGICVVLAVAVAGKAGFIM